ncbi:hypothetical protein [Rhizobium grahamii]|uniref:Uncharacterized protein n=1 Tax=Rhizobium grahamii CCGE 502 TaxID=990285 RepID=S3IA66_9HYPH|nr:hypothetical protein [Rhizobium grahamii]EPE96153.1 hypothetical protein RGCCGE502_21990 [Rhizobium grahamii CCGE 502]
MTESGKKQTSDPAFASSEAFDFWKFDTSLFRLSVDELFHLMKTLDEEASAAVGDDFDDSELFARIEMVETQIEKRYPGRAMTPYKQWLAQH